ncbi:MAG: 1-pyrroline-5-carboxylate dehydrogenase [Bdellovibrionaceae bacterium]|nr:1-pyrroline-5-carboxylate dehydrogenase [Pseudobdellovibrionaceae bacterium]
MSDLEQSIRTEGEEIFRLMEEDSKSIFNKDWWYGRVMDWSMKNEHFKTQMFRFVDVLPYLNSSSEVARHLKEYFAESGDELPSVFNFGLGLGSLAPGIMAGAIRKNVVQMAKMFITGATPEEALPNLKKARKKSLAFTADLLGEAALSEKESLEYLERYLALINDLSKASEKWDANPLIDEDERGALPKVNISVKVTALYSQIEEAAWETSKFPIKERLRQIFSAAIEKNVFVNLDMEQYAYKDFVVEVFKELLMEEAYKAYPHFGIVMQAYLKESLADVQGLCEFAKQRGTEFTIRLVKGAYWDYETIHAEQMGWPVPVFQDKNATDENFESCAKLLIDNYPSIRLAVGSHNVRSLATALSYARQKGLDKKAVETQMLYGMADPIKSAMVKKGIRVREYATIGELIPGMAYLVRRLLENTSNESFLRSKFAENTSIEKLLQNPAHLKKEHVFVENNKHRFENEPLKDFTIDENRKGMESAIAAWKKKGLLKVPLCIDGQWTDSKDTLKRKNPSDIQGDFSEVSMGTTADADRAVEIAAQFQPTWAKWDANKRADLVDQLAELILRDRYKLAALEVLEVGKPWHEADGDITEAIDFCRYYAKEMRKLSNPLRVGHAPGEVSRYAYRARGVSAVIAPWNFPLAILTGMVSASLVTGNTVVMKPAEQSSVVALELMKLIQEAGFPKEAVQFLPGLGEVVGDHLVKHKDVSMICFTGSKAVGIHILQASTMIQPGQTHFKKVLAELGGKNAIIIDSDADLDEAVQGVVYSAFGFQGQKCSACSRVIVLEENYDRFTERLYEATKSLHVGSSLDPMNFMGPVVDEEAFDRIRGTIEKAKSEHNLLFEGEVPKQGYFISPTVFEGVDPKAPIATQEIFGPVLAVIKVKTLDEALEVANSVEFALTGGLFSRSPANIERVKKEFECGNLYINRSCTGAMVNRHPFGGYKMSGLGSKTGGPDYLLQFMEPRVVTENTMRRGFAPIEEDV